MTATMMALRAHTRGGPEQLVYEVVPRPVPAAGEVLVRVFAAATTFDELGWDETWGHLPTTPSHEVSGVVAAVGRHVGTLGVGDEVYGLIRFERNGAAAEYVTVPAADLAQRPRSVSHVGAAAVPLAALTAWQAMVDHAHVAAREQVLVHSGAGGVGAYVTQLAAGLGAQVTATALGVDAEHVRRLGAHRVIDTHRTLRRDTRRVRRCRRHRRRRHARSVVRGPAARRPPDHAAGAAARRESR